MGTIAVTRGTQRVRMNETRHKSIGALALPAFCIHYIPFIPGKSLAELIAAGVAAF